MPSHRHITLEECMRRYLHCVKLEYAMSMAIARMAEMDCNACVPVVSDDDCVQLIPDASHHHSTQLWDSRIVQVRDPLVSARAQDNTNRVYERSDLAPIDTPYVPVHHIHDRETSEVSVDLKLREGAVPINVNVTSAPDPIFPAITCDDDLALNGGGIPTDISAENNRSMVRSMGFPQFQEPADVITFAQAAAA